MSGLTEEFYTQIRNMCTLEDLDIVQDYLAKVDVRGFYKAPAAFQEVIPPLMFNNIKGDLSVCTENIVIQLKKMVHFEELILSGWEPEIDTNAVSHLRTHEEEELLMKYYFGIAGYPVDESPEDCFAKASQLWYIQEQSKEIQNLFLSELRRVGVKVFDDVVQEQLDRLRAGKI